MLDPPQGGKRARVTIVSRNIEFGDCGQIVRIDRRDIFRIGDVSLFLQYPGECGIEVGGNRLHRRGVILVAAGEGQGGKQGQKGEVFHMPVFL